MTNRIGLTFRLRHYNSKIDYNYFYELLDNGRLNRLDDYTGLDEMEFHIMTLIITPSQLTCSFDGFFFQEVN